MQTIADVRDTDAWRRKQLATIGGSNAAAALGRSPWCSRHELWSRMRRAVTGEPLEQREPSDDMRRGTLLEPIGRQMLAEALCRDIDPHAQDCFVTNSVYPWAHALPDGQVRGTNRGAEIKVPRPATFSRVALEGLPGYWLLQGLHNIAVCGWDGCDFGLLDPITCRILHIPIERDDRAIAELMAREGEFYALVQAGTPPANDEPETSVLALPSENGSSIVQMQGEEAQRAAAHYERCQELRDEADSVLEAAKRRLCVLSGCTCDEFGTLSGGPEVFEVSGVCRIYHKHQAGARTFNRPAAEADFPALKDAKYFKQNKPSRPFRYYVLGLRRNGDE